MNRDDLLRILKSVFLVTVPRVLFLYVLAPVLLLILFAQPIAGAVPGSDSAAYLILLVSLGAVVLNWLVYGVIRRKHPSQLVFAYGAFIQSVIDFLIIALCIFFMIKAMNKLTRKKEPEPEAAPEPSAEEKLLTEIRDVLKNK